MLLITRYNHIRIHRYGRCYLYAILKIHIGHVQSIQNYLLIYNGNMTEKSTMILVSKNTFIGNAR
jgi:hypothetical protein